MFKPVLVGATLSFLLVACSQPAAAPQAVDVAGVRAATHERYVAALNSNDLETIMATMAEDIVFQGPGSPETVGKNAVRERMATYLQTYRDAIDKDVMDFTVDGDTAVSRYTYRSATTNIGTGDIIEGEGKGVFVFERNGDGDWELAIDSWNSNTP